MRWGAASGTAAPYHTRSPFSRAQPEFAAGFLDGQALYNAIKHAGGIAMKRSKLLPMLVLLLGPYCFGQVPPTTAKPTSLNPEFSITVDPPAAPSRLGSPI